MNRVVCRVVLYEGCWITQPSKEDVTLALSRTFPAQGDNALGRIEFAEPPEDVALEVEVAVFTRWCHSEIIRDDIIESVLYRFEPEYESMIEVEVEDRE